MSVTIALAAPGLDCESELVTFANSRGLDIRRRCVDAADLLGACLSATGLIAVITAGLPRLSAEVIDRLRACGSRAIGIAVTPEDRASLAGLGVDVIIDSDDDPQRLLASIAGACHSESARPGVWHLQAEPNEPDPVADQGRLIAVWGPAGAPGRTTTAIVLAQCLSEHAPTVIIDADTAAPSLAFQLGLAEDLSGVIVACRHADAGSLSSRALRSTMSQMGEKYFALTGITHARRWAELRPASLTRVLERVRSDFDYGVIDLGFALDTGTSGALPRASVAEAVISIADVVVAVCQAEPLGVARFLADLPELVSHELPIVCVVTGGGQRDQAKKLITEAAGRLGVSIPITDLALEPRALSQALRRGLSVRSRRQVMRRVDSPARLAELVA